jgi:hypothetical protein
VTKDTKAAILAALMVALSVMGGLKAAPPPANVVGEVGTPAVQGVIDLVEAIPTNERLPNPPAYTCVPKDACHPRLAVWRNPRVMEWCNGINWVDEQILCPDAGP